MEQYTEFLAWYNSEKIFTMEAIRFYEWLTYDKMLNMRKLLEIVIYIRKHSMRMDHFINFLETYKLFYARTYKFCKLFDEDLLEWYTYNYLVEFPVYDDHIIKRYYYSIFRKEFYDYNLFTNLDSLSNEQVKFLLKYLRFKDYKPEYHSDAQKFILACKKINYDSKIIIQGLGITTEEYNMYDEDYFAARKNGMSKSDYAKAKEIENAKMDAVDFLYAMYTSAVDLKADEITVSFDAISKIVNMPGFIALFA